jgi:type I restriction enzyme S subunit
VNARIGWKALTAAEYQSDGYAFLATPNIKSLEIDFVDVNYISQHRYEESPELKLATGDVLLSKDGTLGVTNVVRSLPRPATVNGSIAILRPHGIHSGFLRYVIASSVTQERIVAVKDGMGVPHLFQWDIKRLPVPLPPPEEQRRIADFLDAEVRRMDKLLRLKRRQRLVLFEELRGHAILATGRVALHEVLSSEWTHTTLRRVAKKVQTGVTPFELRSSGAATRDGGKVFPWYTPAALGERLSIGVTDKVVDRDPNDAPVPVFREGSVLIVGIGESLGKVAVLDHDATGNQQLTAILPESSIDGRFLAWQLWSAYDEIRDWAQFSRVRIINNETLKSFPVMLPPSRRIQVSVRQELDSRNQSFEHYCEYEDRFAALTAERREALITAGVTGQIDVSTASGRGIEG